MSARPTSIRISLSVCDHGIGISRPELKRIFNRFYRVQSPATGQVKGTGLGLFIVRAVARRYGGDAFAESEGEGLGQHVHPEASQGLSRMSRISDRRRRNTPRRRPPLQPRSRRSLRPNHRQRRRSACIAAQEKNSFRSAGSRRHVAGQRWIHSRPRTPRSAKLHSTADADRARPSRRCAQRIRIRRGRLFSQALQSRDPASPPRKPAAPQKLATKF